MNIIDAIDSNLFLKELFPLGLTEDVFLGQIGFDVEGRISLNIHTKQRPEKEIVKWGVWGKDYDVIVIKLLGRGGKSVNIKNLKNINYSPLFIAQHNDGYIIKQVSDSWSVEFDFDIMIFQRCNVYIDGGDDPAL
ncbi:hypothetical protein TI10_11535 [Photorhabdus luminescens subsp. luminescens]|uniref:Immunity protein 50 n=1 Tax=Photorhabdus luminescens TaxID=29488 RepID=A0A1G5R2V5_PHOLU|nr:hypothetical protein [Photorhabdus luminescens]KMW73075.1 hypothetical protein TI10_11535 [Photorhabdus luminescens subsp. luminescens]SCZ68424.1 hypothetical protein SAMN02982990_02922 [Photorhabdus luminescens]